MLTYAFLKERLINNNSLSSFEYESNYGYNLDSLYNDASMSIESEITNIDIAYPTIITDIVNLVKQADSPSFCSAIINTGIPLSIQNVSG